jgi:hypothetical protein
MPRAWLSRSANQVDHGLSGHAQHRDRHGAIDLVRFVDVVTVRNQDGARKSIGR